MQKKNCLRVHLWPHLKPLKKDMIHIENVFYIKSYDVQKLKNMKICDPFNKCYFF